MESSWYSRTELMLGESGFLKLQNSHIMVVGLGGVGAVATELLVRAGVGRLTLIDSDTVNLTNINRQLVALHSTVGRDKCDVLKERMLDINPECVILTHKVFINESNFEQLVSGCETPLDFIVDCIDTLSPKVALIQTALRLDVRLVSSMGAGAKLDPERVKVKDISKTSYCPLAHMLRKRLHKLGIRKGFQAVFSDEPPITEAMFLSEEQNKKSNVGTISYMPWVFGLNAASEVIRTIVEKK